MCREWTTADGLVVVQYDGAYKLIFTINISTMTIFFRRCSLFKAF